MSRAFVKETDVADVLQRLEPVLPDGAQNHVTPWGAAMFRERLAAAQAERAALDDGPMRQARKAELRWLERRMATFVETSPAPDPERVGFGSVVTLEGDRGAARGGEGRRRDGADAGRRGGVGDQGASGGTLM